MLLTESAGWEDALEQLTALPGSLQDQFGDVNFMRAGRHRRNGRRLFEEGIRPLLAAGRRIEVVTGFIDNRIAEEAALGRDDGFIIGSDEFKSAILRDVDSGELIEISVASTMEP